MKQIRKNKAMIRPIKEELDNKLQEQLRKDLRQIQRSNFWFAFYSYTVVGAFLALVVWTFSLIF